jgi:hypothetical protein
MSAPDFDGRAAHFTQLMQTAADWKYRFSGAAYSTRLASAVLLAESACREARRLLADAGSPVPEHDTHAMLAASLKTLGGGAEALTVQQGVALAEWLASMGSPDTLSALRRAADEIALFVKAVGEFALQAQAERRS